MIYLKQMFVKRQRAETSKKYKYAIMIISPLRQFANKIQKVDFLIDNELIKKEDVIFLSYKKMMKNAENYLNNHHLNFFGDIDVFISYRDIKGVLPLYFDLLASPNTNSFVLTASVNLIYYYLLP